MVDGSAGRYGGTRTRRARCCYLGGTTAPNRASEALLLKATADEFKQHMEAEQ